jgi:crotonobetainyl-CoA:carnitine CoA-transferase CaiB-like acyl-CoA transferase
MTDHKGPLAGIRIVDLTAIISGPLATQILADQGADVIKVEPPGIGDLTRQMGTGRNGLSAIYAAANRNKRSVVLDLGTDEGLELLRRLVATADVLAQNFRPGAAARMGIGYEAMAKLNPDLVYASISGFGSSGPHSARRVYDPLIQAASGMAWAQGQGPDSDGVPKLVRSIVCDKVTALTAAQAITAALFARDRGAGGQHLELSMLDSAIAFHWSDMMWNHSFIEQSGDGPDISRTPDLADMFRVSKTADGYVVAVSASDVEFQGMCRAFESPEMLNDPRFATLPDRMQHMAEILEWQTAELAERTSDEVCALLDDNGVPCAKVNSIPQLAEDPQVRHNGSIEVADHPIGGSMVQPLPAARFEKTPASVRRPAPAHGENTEEVLLEIGVPQDRIVSLRNDGVLGP